MFEIVGTNPRLIGTYIIIYWQVACYRWFSIYVTVGKADLALITISFFVRIF